KERGQDEGARAGRVAGPARHQGAVHPREAREMRERSMTASGESRRSFLKTSAALAGAASLMDSMLRAEPEGDARPLLAYVGTFSSPLRDVLPTQVDLPPGN